MRAIEIEPVPELDLSILSIRQGINFDRLNDFIGENFLQEPTRHLIVYLATGVTGLFSVDEMKRLLATRLENAQMRYGGHTVFVLEDQNDGPFMRWFRAYAKHELDWPVQYHFSDSIPNAINLIRDLTANQDG